MIGGDGNALTALANRARKASSGVLLSLETVGLALALGIYAMAPARWPLILPCIALSAYGLWGLCDRLIAVRSGRRYRTERRILRLIKLAIATVGVAAAFAAAYLLMGWTMGVFIS